MTDQTSELLALAAHGGAHLPSVEVDSYNVEIRDDEGFVGDRITSATFRDFIDDRAPMRIEVIGQIFDTLPVHERVRPRHRGDPLAHFLCERVRAARTGQLHPQASFGRRITLRELDQQFSQSRGAECFEILCIERCLRHSVHGSRSRKANQKRSPASREGPAFSSPGAGSQADNWLVLTDALFAESGRSLLHHRVTDFDAKPTFAGDAPLYRFCPESRPTP